METPNTTSSSPAFQGTGWAFPPRFSLDSKEVALVRGEEDIRQSLHILLTTEQGERLMREEFGCDLHRVLFDRLDTTTETYVQDLVETALLYYEPRIALEEVHLLPMQNDGNGLTLELTYTIKATNTRTNQVFPFYLLEGTDLSL